MLLQSGETSGHIIPLKTTHPKHITESGFKGEEKPGAEKSFGDVLLSAFNNVNDIQSRANNISEQLITDPDSINVHDVTIALAEANLSIAMTKAVVDRALRAYKEIITIR